MLSSGNTVAIVALNVSIMIISSSQMFGNLFDTMIVTFTVKVEVLITAGNGNLCQTALKYPFTIQSRQFAALWYVGYWGSSLTA